MTDSVTHLKTALDGRLPHRLRDRRGRDGWGLSGLRICTLWCRDY